MLNDAILNGDDSCAHAVGTRGRDQGWVDVAEKYQAEFFITAGAAEALNYIDEMATGPAYNLASQIAFSAPSRPLTGHGLPPRAAPC